MPFGCSPAFFESVLFVSVVCLLGEYNNDKKTNSQELNIYERGRKKIVRDTCGRFP